MEKANKELEWLAAVVQADDMNDQAEKLARFKAAFKSLGLSQSKFADALGLKSGQPYVSQLLNGKQAVTEPVVRLAEMLAMDRDPVAKYKRSIVHGNSVEYARALRGAIEAFADCMLEWCGFVSFVPSILRAFDEHNPTGDNLWFLPILATTDPATLKRHAKKVLRSASYRPMSTAIQAPGMPQRCDVYVPEANVPELDDLVSEFAAWVTGVDEYRDAAGRG